MDKPTKLVVDCSTGEQTVVELSSDEIAQMEADHIAFEAAQAAAAATAAAKAEAKASALAKLAALGLSEEEAAALAG